MMENSYFIRTYLTKRYLAIFGVLFPAIALFLKFIADTFLSLKFLNLGTAYQLFLKLSNSLIFLDFLIMISLLCLIIIDLGGVYKGNNLPYYLKSWIETYYLHKFLHQNEHDNLQLTPNIQNTQANPVYVKKFNKFAKRSVVQVTKTHIIVLLRIPFSSQSQKILLDMNESLRSHLSSRFPEYYLSGAQRKKNILIYIGENKNSI